MVDIQQKQKHEFLEMLRFLFSFYKMYESGKSFWILKFQVRTSYYSTTKVGSLVSSAEFIYLFIIYLFIIPGRK